MCLHRNYSREQIRSLIRFIDGILYIMDTMKNRILYEELKREEGDRPMEYLTSFEEMVLEDKYNEGYKVGEKLGVKLGEKRGEKLGEKKMAQKIAREMLIKGEPMDRIQLYTGLTSAEIAELSVDHINR